MSQLETINLVRSEGGENAAQIILMESILKLTGTPRKGEPDRFKEITRGHNPVVEVVLTVNGTQVPLIETLNALWAREEARLDERALERANELISQAGLAKVQAALEEAEWKIKQALEEAIKQ